MNDLENTLLAFLTDTAMVAWLPVTVWLLIGAKRSRIKRGILAALLAWIAIAAVISLR